VVGVSDKGEGARRYLFTRRPKTGLLANQWEFPTFPLPSEACSHSDWDAAFSSFCDMLSSYSIHIAPVNTQQLEERQGDPGSPVHLMTRTQFDDPIVHIFSHQKHFMHILSLEGRADAAHVDNLCQRHISVCPIIKRA
jgi:adenine-specific DNA glycosylase